jgi:hypothetical protein
MDTEELTNQNQGRSRPFFPVSQPVQDFLDIRHKNFLYVLPWNSLLEV